MFTFNYRYKNLIDKKEYVLLQKHEIEGLIKNKIDSENYLTVNDLSEFDLKSIPWYAIGSRAKLNMVFIEKYKEYIDMSEVLRNTRTHRATALAVLEKYSSRVGPCGVSRSKRFSRKFLTRKKLFCLSCSL